MSDTPTKKLSISASAWVPNTSHLNTSIDSNQQDCKGTEVKEGIIHQSDTSSTSSSSSCSSSVGSMNQLGSNDVDSEVNLMKTDMKSSKYACIYLHTYIHICTYIVLAYKTTCMASILTIVSNHQAMIRAKQM